MCMVMSHWKNYPLLPTCKKPLKLLLIIGLIHTKYHLYLHHVINKRAMMVKDKFPLLRYKYLKPAEQFSEFFKGYKFQWISIILDLDRDSRHLNDLILIFCYRLYYKLENIVLFVFVLFCFCLCFFFGGWGGVNEMFS